MSYNKHTWANGNVVGAVDLNRMEDGIEAASSGGGNTFVIKMTERDATTEECSNGGTYTEFDCSWQDVYDAVTNGVPIQILMEADETGFSVRYPVDITADITLGVYKMNIRMYEGNSLKYYRASASSATEPLTYLDCGAL